MFIRNQQQQIATMNEQTRKLQILTQPSPDLEDKMKVLLKPKDKDGLPLSQQEFWTWNTSGRIVGLVKKPLTRNLKLFLTRTVEAFFLVQVSLVINLLSFLVVAIFPYAGQPPTSLSFVGPVISPISAFCVFPQIVPKPLSLSASLLVELPVSSLALDCFCLPPPLSLLPFLARPFCLLPLASDLSTQPPNQNPLLVSFFCRKLPLSLSNPQPPFLLSFHSFLFFHRSDSLFGSPILPSCGCPSVLLLYELPGSFSRSFSLAFSLQPSTAKNAPPSLRLLFFLFIWNPRLLNPHPNGEDERLTIP